MRLVLATALLFACQQQDGDSQIGLPDPDAPASEASDTVPVTGGTLAISPDGSLAAAADIAGDRVYLIALPAGTVVGEVALNAGDQPARLLVDNDGIVFASLRGSGEVARLDPIGAAVLARTDVCRSPRGMALDGDGIWLACASGELVELSANDGSKRSSSFVEHDLRDVVVAGSDLMISSFKTAELLTVSKQGVVQQRRVAQVFDNQLVGITDVPDFWYSPGTAWRTINHPDGGVLMLHQRGSQALIAPIPDDPVTPRTYYGPDPVVPEAPRPGCSGLVHSALSWFPADGGAPITSSILGFASLATDVAAAPGGEYAVVATGANDDLGAVASDVVRVDDNAFDLTLTDCIVGSMEAIEDSSQVTSVDYAPDGTQVAIGRSPFRVYVNGVAIDLNLPEDEDPERTAYVGLGFDLFHKDASVGMTCASCHPEGQEDGRTWIFNEVGPRRTQSMAGGLRDTAPFHWGGEFYNFSTLMTEVLVRRLGHAAIGPVESDALGDWMDEIATVKVTPEAGQLAAAKGAELFYDETTQCSWCHEGSLFTKNLTIDVGTGGAFQVPSLRGVGSRAPYLHDGCAKTLQDRFGPCGGGDAHGRTSHLNSEQIDQIVAFLQTL